MWEIIMARCWILQKLVLQKQAAVRVSSRTMRRKKARGARKCNEFPISPSHIQQEGYAYGMFSVFPLLTTGLPQESPSPSQRATEGQEDLGL